MRAHVGPGYRVYFTRTERTVYVLLTEATNPRNRRTSRAPRSWPAQSGRISNAEDFAPFDAAAYLDRDEVIAEYLTQAAEDPDPEVFLAALGDVAKARGMAQIAKDARLGRESLYKALSADSHPVTRPSMLCMRSASSLRLSPARTIAFCPDNLCLDGRSGFARGSRVGWLS